MGTRNIMHSTQGSKKDHPHAYGDKVQDWLPDKSITGSSPRVWGQGENTANTVSGCRIIPTRMGTSCRASENRERHRDHPHAYGDKFITPSLEYHHLRIIPTRMGTRRLRRRATDATEDHPHAYGDKMVTPVESGTR